MEGGRHPFTLVLGGFAAVLHEGTGFQAMLHFFVGKTGKCRQAFSEAAAGLGIICFFDGLANSMLVGRVCKDMAEKCGVSRVKLAYIVDSTSSAVACVAFVSTWIAYQLSMIKEGFRLAGRDVNPYLIFIKSIPFNFYCWFTLVMLFVSILRRFNPGSMQRFENEARALTTAGELTLFAGKGAGVHSVLIPLITLISLFFAGFYLLGSPEPKWPVTAEKITAAFGSNAGPLVLVLSSLIATGIALLLFPPGKTDISLRACWPLKAEFNPSSLPSSYWWRPGSSAASWANSEPPNIFRPWFQKQTSRFSFPRSYL
jgi:tetracycline resistance efflux pump